MNVERNNDTRAKKKGKLNVSAPFPLVHSWTALHIYTIGVLYIKSLGICIWLHFTWELEKFFDQLGNCYKLVSKVFQCAPCLCPMPFTCPKYPKTCIALYISFTWKIWHFNRNNKNHITTIIIIWLTKFNTQISVVIVVTCENWNFSEEFNSRKPFKSY